MCTTAVTYKMEVKLFLLQRALVTEGKGLQAFFERVTRVVFVVDVIL